MRGFHGPVFCEVADDEPDEVDPDEISGRGECPDCEPPESCPYATGEAYR